MDRKPGIRETGFDGQKGCMPFAMFWKLSKNYWGKIKNMKYILTDAGKKL